MTKQLMKKSSTTKLNLSADVHLIPQVSGPGVFKEGDRVKVSLGGGDPIHAYGVVSWAFPHSIRLVLKPKGRCPAHYKGTWYFDLQGDATSRRFSTFLIERFGEDVCSFKADNAPDHFCDVVVTVLNGRKSKPAAKKGAR